MVLLITGMAFHIININKGNNYVEITRDFIFFTLKRRRFPIDDIWDFKDEIITNSDGFSTSKYLSLKLVLKNSEEIEIYNRDLLDSKKNPIEIVKEECHLIKYFLMLNLGM
jgi:hypothetical protein